MKDKRLWIIFLIVFVNLLGFGIILPLLPYYVESFGANPVYIGLLAAAYSFFQLLSAPVLGELSDKIGRRPILLFSIAGTALSFFLLGWAKTLPLLFLARIIDGISGGNISTSQAYIADITSKENRTAGMGVMAAAASLGFVIGPAVGGILSQWGYAVPAFTAAWTAVAATILTYFFLPESVKNSGEIKKRKILFSWADFRDALGHPKVGIVMTIGFFVMVALSLMQGTFALYSEHRFHFSAQQNGYFFAYFGLVGVVIQIFLLKKILKHLSETKVAVLGVAFIALGMMGMVIDYGLSGILTGVTLLAFGQSISGPVLAGLVSKLSSEKEQGNVMGVFQSLGSLARMIGPVAGTYMYEAISIKSPFIFAAVIMGISTIVSGWRLKFPGEKLQTGFKISRKEN